MADEKKDDQGQAVPLTREKAEELLRRGEKVHKWYEEGKKHQPPTGQPLFPIVLTRFNDAIIVNPDWPEGEATPDVKNNPLGIFYVHHTCGGLVGAKEISISHKAFECNQCGLRAPFPKGLETLEEVKDYFWYELNPLPHQHLRDMVFCG